MPENNRLIDAARTLREDVAALFFSSPVACVYNPLDYAWAPHVQYLSRWGGAPKRVVFLGMNPGPWGMAQVGVPFGEIRYVRDWVGVEAEVRHPDNEHPKRPVTGFDCGRSEVSGRRLWGFFAEGFGEAGNFFRDHFVANYCPLMFMEESGRNVTPDKLRKPEQAPLFKACDKHLRAVVRILQPDWVVGVGAFAAGRAGHALSDMVVRIGKVLHPSPASPAANRGWAAAAGKQLTQQGIW